MMKGSAASSPQQVVQATFGRAVATEPTLIGGTLPVATPHVSVDARLLFVDLARALAVLMMIQGHALNVLLEESWRHSATYGTWLFARGLTSPTFLLLSGLSFGLATTRRWQENCRLSPSVGRRVARSVGFVLLGYLMHFPVRGLEHFASLSAARWESFLQVDILQCIGVMLLALQLLVLLARTAARFALVSFALGMAVLATSPAVRAVAWKQHLSVPLAAYLYSGSGSLFPLFGWAAFILIGAALGVVISRQAARTPFGICLTMLGAGCAFLGSGLLLGSLDVGTGQSGPAVQGNPDFLLVRLGSVLLLLTLLDLIASRFKRLAEPLQALAKSSLVVYFVHVCLLYGCIWFPGLRQALGPTLSPGPTLALIVTLMLAMVALSHFWTRYKQRHPRGKHGVRVAILFAMIAPLV